MPIEYLWLSPFFCLVSLSYPRLDWCSNRVVEFILNIHAGSAAGSMTGVAPPPTTRPKQRSVAWKGPGISDLRWNCLYLWMQYLVYGICLGVCFSSTLYKTWVCLKIPYTVSIIYSNFTGNKRGFTIGFWVSAVSYFPTNPCVCVCVHCKPARAPFLDLFETVFKFLSISTISTISR